MLDLLITNGTLVTMDAGHRVIPKGYVAVEAGKITDIGPMSQLPSSTVAQRTVDATHQVILPGFIDTHGHAGHALTKTLSLGPNWTGAVEEIYYQYTTPDFWHAEARLAALEKVRFATTTSVSMIGSVPRIGDQEAIAGHFCGAESLGTRTISGIGSPNPPWPKVTRRWQGEESTSETLWPSHAYPDTEAVIKRWHNTNRGKTYAFVMPSRIGIAPPNATDLAIEQMREMRRIADAYGTRIHGHAYAGDVRFTLEHFPRGLGNDVLLAHCTGLNSQEIGILADTGTHVTTGPSTHAHISAHCPVPELLEQGVNVVISTDGNAPDRTFDLWKDLRHCQLLHRNRLHDAALLPAGTVLEMVTIRAARALGLDHLIGSLEVNKRADIVLISTQKAHLWPFVLPVEKLVQGASGQDVTSVIVDGTPIILDGRLLTGCEKTILEQAQRELELALSRGELWSALEYQEGLWDNRYTMYEEN